MTKARRQNGPLVSVLISTYNRPAYLAEALESIFAQTWPHLQVVLVRDGGQPVREVVDHFSDSRLVFIDRDRNRGLPYSFNEALSKARGEYICYLGDDDKFYPHHIECLLRAMENQDRCGVVYSDLYKAHCRVASDGRRIVLAKNVEISRDFDRMVMLQFNHVLHVSVMHRKELLERAGGYNEDLNVLIDWDLNRKLCFYSDFLHVPEVTGEYYGPVGDCDRISVQRRKNVSEYLRNVLTIRTTRPPKPWDCIRDLAVLILAQRADESLDQTLRDLWSHTFYPNQIYVALPNEVLANWNPAVPNVVKVPVDSVDSMSDRVDRMLAVCEGDYVALVPTGLTVETDEVAWLERALQPLLNSPEMNTAFELPESSEHQWGAVFRKSELVSARSKSPQLGLRESAEAAGIYIRKPKFEEYPFQFDHILMGAEQVQREEGWMRASRLYEHLSSHFGNELWMQVRGANALYQAGRYEAALDLIRRVNQTRPTVSSLQIEGRICEKRKDYGRAIAVYQQADAILEDRREKTRKRTHQRKKVWVDPAACGSVSSQQESRTWT